MAINNYLSTGLNANSLDNSNQLLNASNQNLIPNSLSPSKPNLLPNANQMMMNNSPPQFQGSNLIPQGYPPYNMMPSIGFPQNPAMFPKMGYKNPLRLGASPIEILNQLFSIFIEQRPDIIQVLTGIETQHKYTVYGTQEILKDEKPHAKIKAFSCKEHSDFCERVCCRAQRELKIDMFAHIIQNNQTIKAPFLTLRKPYLCTCGCCNRPFLDVFYTGIGATNPNGGDHIGTVVNPCACSLSFEIYQTNKLSSPRFLVEGSVCQCGYMCSCPVKSCSTVYFDLYDLVQHKKIGNLTKIFSGFFVEALTDAYNYVANFPKELDWKEKALIIACLILMDYRYFDDPKPRGRGSGYPMGMMGDPYYGGMGMALGMAAMPNKGLSASSIRHQIG